jgi:DNA-directed RNA polymerase specialized sigma24 family protein
LIRRTLDELEQRALWMRCVERLSIDEITEKMGIADRSGARALLQRARRKLARAMD